MGETRMIGMKRREFLALTPAARLVAAPALPRIGLVTSGHARLARPSSPEDPLDYQRVRDMVWKAIEYAGARAGSLEAKIRPGSWVVIKPNIVSLRPSSAYRLGDITDPRVTRAVVEYVARRARAARITIAEGGSYRRLSDTTEDHAAFQNGQRVDLTNFDWGTEDYPGFGGSFGRMIAEFGKEFPGARFDYVDLSYDAYRDASGKLRRIQVPRAPNGVGAFGARPDYYIARTIRECDFLIDVPVIKVHLQCGLTACLKNYVGTAVREAYQSPGLFNNSLLHREHSLDNRIDHFIADLASFHPPDYCVMDGICGLQYQEHNNDRADQMVRSNLVLAGEDPVALDAMAATLIGFRPWDIEYLHLAASRGMGTLDLDRADLAGDDPERLRRRWEKPRRWYGRCNREWLLTKSPDADLAAWTRHTSRFDTLDFSGWSAAAVRVRAEGHRKAILWVGAQGRLGATLNGETVMREEARTRYRVGQFQKPVELRPGENLLVFRLEALSESARLSVLLTGPRNDGDTVEGIRWSA
jgi:uncharacterized protein (DUF362 family)